MGQEDYDTFTLDTSLQVGGRGGQTSSAQISLMVCDAIVAGLGSCQAAFSVNNWS